MKYLFFVFCFVFSIHLVQATSFVADTVKVGFQKDTISILEGESQIITIELNGIISKELKDSTIDIKWTIKDCDATVGKDFKIIGKEKFTFLRSESPLQKEFFEIVSIKDENIENETLLLELTIIKGGKLNKIIKKTCLIILKDFKTELETLKEKLENERKEFTAEKNQILEKLSNVSNNDKDTSEVIGSIRLKNTVLTKWKSKDGTKNKGYKFNTNEIEDTKSNATISKVDVKFKYGVASEIRAFSKDSAEIFSNLWSPNSEQICHRYGISYRHNAISKRNSGYYLIGEKDKSLSIRLNDLLDYTHRTDKNFVPSDTLITLYDEKKKKEADISIKTSLNSYINFNIYTDLLGLLRIDQGNGIIQSDASAKIFLTTLPARNKLRFHLNYLMPYARYARFENGFQNVPNTENKSFGVSETDTMNRMLLNQRKFFDVGLKINIINWIGKFDNNFELNAFSGFGWFNRQGDSLKTLPNKEIMYESLLTNTFEFGLEARTTILQYRNFGINTGLLATYQKLINAKQNRITDGRFKPFYRIEAEIFYYPIAKSKDKIFLRTYYTFNNSSTEESFLRIQVGYKALFKISNKRQS